MHIVMLLHQILVSENAVCAFKFSISKYLIGKTEICCKTESFLKNHFQNPRGNVVLMNCSRI